MKSKRASMPFLCGGVVPFPMRRVVPLAPATRFARPAPWPPAKPLDFE